MNRGYSEPSRATESESLIEFQDKRTPRSFALELTARCNNDCRHCCINLPAGDSAAKSRELTLDETRRIAAEAVGMGVISCLVTGGEPLLRDDFEEVYVMLKRLGLLVTVGTNACLVSSRHVELFSRYPPRSVHVRVFGSTPETYERVTRRSGSFRTYEQGLSRLLESGLNVRLTAVGLRSNAHELPAIARFCHARVKGNYTITSHLPLRLDGDQARNEEIVSERLSPAEVVAIERFEAQWSRALPGGREASIPPDRGRLSNDRFSARGTLGRDFTVGYDGRLRLRSADQRPAHDLRHGSLREAWLGFAHETGAGPHGNEDKVVESRTSHSDSTVPFEFLLRCLSATNSDSPEPSVPRSPDDWDCIMEQARNWGLSPLLYKRLESRPTWSRVPPDVRLGLGFEYSVSLERDALLHRTLPTVLRHLRSKDIPVIVLKGSFLGEVVYGDVALRPMVDIDLLVPKAELTRAQAVLLDMGHGPKERQDIDLLCRRSKHLDQFVGVNSRVELHWSIANPTSPFKIDITGLWERARPATVAGVQVLALSPEDLLLHLCIHASQNHRLDCGLRPFCDIAEVIRYYGSELDWRQFVDRAREWSATRHPGLTLHLARELLGVPVPESVLRQLVPGGLDPRLLKQATECVLAEKPYERDDNWAILPFPNQLGDKTTREKVKTLWNVIFLSRNEMALRHPGSRDSKHLWPYHLLRLVDLPRMYGLATMRQGFRIVHTHKRNNAPSLARWLNSGRP